MKKEKLLSLCSGEGCPLKETCIRFQSYDPTKDNHLAWPPYKDGQCGFYMEKTDPKELIKPDDN